MRPGIVAALAATALAVAVAAAQDWGGTAGPVEQGRRLFVDQGCYGCHTIGAFGTPIGPDLSRLGVKYAPSYLEQWLRDPAVQRPAAHMPRLELTDPQVKALAAFLSSLH